MISEMMAKHFVNAARALATGKKDSGYASTGVKQLHFVADVPDQGKKVFTVIEQNPNRMSTPAAKSRMGHQIFQVRDNERGALIGNVDLSENPVRFNSYENIPQPVDISEVEQALGSDVSNEEVAVSAARSPSSGGQGQAGGRVFNIEDLGGNGGNQPEQGHHGDQNNQGNRGGQQPNNWLLDEGGKKAA